MATPINVENMRDKLKAMGRKDAQTIAAIAGVPSSTMEKFRLGHTAEPRYKKLLALHNALSKHARKKKAVA